MPQSAFLDFLNRHYAGPFEIEARLETSGGREAYRVRGPGGRFAAKITAAGRPEATVHADAHTPYLLAAQGFPAPRVVESLDGRLYLPYNDRFIYLYAYIEGRHPYPNPDFYARLGTLMAQLHALPHEGVPEASYRPPKELAAIRTALLAVKPPEQRALLPGLLEMIDTFPDFSSLPLGIIHTDPYFVNLIEAPDGTLYLIDWEDGGVSYPLLDVGYVLAHLCSFTPRDRSLWRVPGPETGILWRPEWGKIFLRSYEAVRPLSAAERALLRASALLNFLVYLPMWETDEIILENYQRLMAVASGEAGI
jgi:Ser/Thr protein kinase RdoA (MazF antagonist)